MRLCVTVVCSIHTHGERFGKETIIATKNKNTDFILRPWKVSNAKVLARYLNNKKIWNNCRDGLPFLYTETDADAFIKYASEQVERNEYCIEVNHEVIGNIGFARGTDVERFNAGVGYWISEIYWNKGLATAVLGRAIKYCFQHTDVIRLYAMVYGRNAASMCVLERARLQRAGIHRKVYFKNGQFIDAHYYELLKNKS